MCLCCRRVLAPGPRRALAGLAEGRRPAGGPGTAPQVPCTRLGHTLPTLPPSLLYRGSGVICSAVRIAIVYILVTKRPQITPIITFGGGRRGLRVQLEARGVTARLTSTPSTPIPLLLFHPLPSPRLLSAAPQEWGGEVGLVKGPFDSASTCPSPPILIAGQFPLRYCHVNPVRSPGSPRYRATLSAVTMARAAVLPGQAASYGTFDCSWRSYHICLLSAVCGLLHTLF